MIRNDTKYDVNAVLDLVRNIPVGIRDKVKQTSPQHTMIFENLKSVLNIICNSLKNGV